MFGKRSILLCLFITFSSVLKSAEDSVYDFLWLDPDKAVYVLQNKVYKKKGSFAAGVDLLKTVGQEFTEAYGINLKGQFYFTEELGVEGFYTQYNNELNTAYDNVLSVTGSEPFIRRLDSAIGLTFLWTPFYGKVNTFNKIVYFDWGFGLGVASLEAESNSSTVLNESVNAAFSSENYTGIQLKTDFKVHMSKKYFLNIEFRRFMYQATGAPNPNTNQTAGKKLKSHSDILIGLGVKF